MSEELEDMQQEVNPLQVQLHVEPTHEDHARQQGWRPKEEWEGNPEDWVDAKTFNQRGEYMERIKSQSSLIKKLEKRLSKQESTLEELAEHHRRVSEIEYKKALEQLKGLKKEALDLGDHEKVVEIDDKIQDLKDTKPQEKAPTTNDSSMHPDVEAWIDENPWYEEDLALQGAAEALVKAEVARNPSASKDIRATLDKVTAKLKEDFPNKFGIKQRSRTSTVTEPGSSDQTLSRTSSNKYTAKHLNDFQKQVAKRFIQAGAIKSMDEYAKQLADIGELDAQRGV